MSERSLRKRSSSLAISEEYHCKKLRQSNLFEQNKCIFCEKELKYLKGNKKESLTKCQTDKASTSIINAVKAQEDWTLHAKIGGRCLVSAEALYHNTCRRNYLCKKVEKINDEEKISITSFDFICKHIDEHVLQSDGVETLEHVHELYQAHMKENNLSDYSPKYKQLFLKNKLNVHYKDNLCFKQIEDSSGVLVFGSAIKVESVAKMIYTGMKHVKCEDELLSNAALKLRKAILDAKAIYQSFNWPPQAAELVSKMYTTIPEHLEHFLMLLLLGKRHQLNEKKKRVVHSIGQDICYSATDGTFKMPKHHLLAQTIHHLTGSSDIVTLMNRHGHCLTYTEVMEIETAVCEQIITQESTLPPSISSTQNEALHACFDNFDLAEQTETGAGTTHSTHGILIQHQTGQCDKNNNIIVHKEKPKNAKRSVTLGSHVLQPCYAKPKAEPPMQFKQFEISQPSKDSLTFAIESDLLWVICRHQNADDQKVPGWAGWVSKTGKGADAGPTPSTIGYLPPINNPITENSTVIECLDITLKASEEVSQQYGFVTFDLAAAKKALNLVWQFDKYNNVIVMMGVFHTVCAYLSALGKFVRGSGFEEIVIESGICASNSTEAILVGKNYNRSLRVHKIMMESLERMLLSIYLQENPIDNDTHSIIQSLSDSPSEKKLVSSLEKPPMREFLTRYMSYREEIIQGRKGKTAQFWLMYIKMVANVLNCIRATKENNLPLHIASFQPMNALFFAFDHPNYARFNTYQYLALLNIEQTHPRANKILEKNGFSVSRSEVSCSRNSIDITIEQTINCHAKSKGGIVGFSRNQGAYQRWCVTRNHRASIASCALDIAGMRASDDVLHRDIADSAIASSEKAVSDVMKAFNNFMCPFSINELGLYCIASGIPAPKEAQLITSAIEQGCKARDNFIDSTFKSKSAKFYDSMKRLKIPTFSNSKVKSKLTSSKNKLVEVSATRNIFGQLLNLSQEKSISLEKIMEYALGPVPWSLAMPDGTLTKTPKHTLLANLEKGTEPISSTPNDAIFIYDANMSFYQMQKVPKTFGDLAMHIFETLPRDSDVIHCIPDSYNKISIKETERQRRGISDPIVLKGPTTITPKEKEWKNFLMNSRNKEQLVSFILNEWTKNPAYIKKLGNKSIYYSDGKTCLLITSDGNKTSAVVIDALCSSQEEADTKVILHMLYAANESDKPIIVRSVDTDVFLLLLKYSTQVKQLILMDVGTSDKRRLLDIQAIAACQGSKLCEALPSFHAFTGCDSTSAFVRRGKLQPLRIIRTESMFMDLFMTLGNSLELTETQVNKAQHFVCLMYDRKTKQTEINKLRYILFQQRYSPKTNDTISYDGIDLSLLPPCKDSLIQHLKRANYQAFIWKNAHMNKPALPNPERHGWKLVDGEIEPNWSDEPILPDDLIDILAEKIATDALTEEVDNDSSINEDFEANDVIDE